MREEGCGLQAVGCRPEKNKTLGKFRTAKRAAGTLSKKLLATAYGLQPTAFFIAAPPR